MSDAERAEEERIARSMARRSGKGVQLVMKKPDASAGVSSSPSRAQPAAQRPESATAPAPAASEIAPPSSESAAPATKGSRLTPEERKRLMEEQKAKLLREAEEKDRARTEAERASKPAAAAPSQPARPLSSSTAASSPSAGVSVGGKFESDAERNNAEQARLARALGGGGSKREVHLKKPEWQVREEERAAAEAAQRASRASQAPRRTADDPAAAAAAAEAEQRRQAEAKAAADIDARLLASRRAMADPYLAINEFLDTPANRAGGGASAIVVPATASPSVFDRYGSGNQSDASPKLPVSSHPRHSRLAAAAAAGGGQIVYREVEVDDDDTDNNSGNNKNSSSSSSTTTTTTTATSQPTASSAPTTAHRSLHKQDSIAAAEASLNALDQLLASHSAGPQPGGAKSSMLELTADERERKRKEEERIAAAAKAREDQRAVNLSRATYAGPSSSSSSRGTDLAALDDILGTLSGKSAAAPPLSPRRGAGADASASAEKSKQALELMKQRQREDEQRREEERVRRQRDDEEREKAALALARDRLAEAQSPINSSVDAATGVVARATRLASLHPLGAASADLSQFAGLTNQMLSALGAAKDGNTPLPTQIATFADLVEQLVVGARYALSQNRDSSVESVLSASAKRLCETASGVLAGIRRVAAAPDSGDLRRELKSQCDVLKDAAATLARYVGDVARQLAAAVVPLSPRGAGGAAAAATPAAASVAMSRSTVATPSATGLSLGGLQRSASMSGGVMSAEGQAKVELIASLGRSMVNALNAWTNQSAPKFVADLKAMQTAVGELQRFILMSAWTQANAEVKQLAAAAMDLVKVWSAKGDLAGPTRTVKTLLMQLLMSVSSAPAAAVPASPRGPLPVSPRQAAPTPAPVIPKPAAALAPLQPHPPLATPSPRAAAAAVAPHMTPNAQKVSNLIREHVATTQRLSALLSAPSLDEDALVREMKEVVRITREAQTAVTVQSTNDSLGSAAKAVLQAGLAYKNGSRSNTEKAQLTQALAIVFDCLSLAQRNA